MTGTKGSLTVNSRGKDLAHRFRAFNEELASFVESCSDADWQKICPGEGWSVGVVARHVVGGHFGVLKLAKMIIDGEELPPITADVIDQSNARHAQKHANCTKQEVLGILREKGASAVDYLAGVGDADLERKAYMELANGRISAEQFIERSILRQAAEHLANMKVATRH
jgi:hypothetical protein